MGEEGRGREGCVREVTKKRKTVCQREMGGEAREGSNLASLFFILFHLVHRLHALFHLWTVAKNEKKGLVGKKKGCWDYLSG
jgi:hypothetical protein